MLNKFLAQVVAWSIVFIAMQAGATNLLDAYDSAYNNDRAWRLAQAKHLDSRELEVQARSQLLPSLTLSASNNNLTQQLTTGATVAPSQTYLAVRVVSAYLDAMLARDREALLESQMSTVQMRMKQVRASLRAGQGTRTDIDQAQAELDKIAADQIKARLAISYTTKKLELLTGQPQREISQLNLKKFRTDAFMLPQLEVLLDRATSTSPGLQARRADIQVAQSLLKQAEAGHQPTLDLLAQASDARGDNSYYPSTRNKSHLLGVQLSMPLYSGGSVSSQVRQALARLSQAHEQYEGFLNDFTSQLHNESNSVAEGVLRVKALETALASADQLVYSTQKGVQGRGASSTSSKPSAVDIRLSST
jgi:outer membrane protein, protease secretion system